MIGETSIIPDIEYNLMINEFNDTAAVYPMDKCVHELFSEQTAKTPDKVALVFEDKQFTYKQLDEMSNSLAHHLREKGIKPDDVVPIIAKRSWHIIVAMLGILKAGGAYMPVDPEYPTDRIEYMFETAKATTAVVYGYNKSLNIDKTDLDAFDYSANIEKIENKNQPEDLCYVIFTSGSTGKPKDSKTEYIYEAFQNDMDENGRLVYDSNIRIKNDFTDWFMRKLGFEWAHIDYEYIRAYVEYFRGIGYLEV